MPCATDDVDSCCGHGSEQVRDDDGLRIMVGSAG